MTVKQWLHRARTIDTEITEMLAKKQQIRDNVLRITQTYERSEAQVTKDPHKLDKLIEIENQIDELVDSYVATLLEIVNVISQVQDSRQRRILMMYYTGKDEKTGELLKWEQVAVMVHYSYKQTKRIHAKGCYAVAEILKANNVLVCPDIT